MIMFAQEPHSTDELGNSEGISGNWSSEIHLSFLTIFTDARPDNRNFVTASFLGTVNNDEWNNIDLQ